jgi:hypothetical protein
MCVFVFFGIWMPISAHETNRTSLVAGTVGLNCEGTGTQAYLSSLSRFCFLHLFF